ncbi:unnamed protein product [Prunus armeniaca]
MLYSDVWGPSPITAPSGVRWFVTFIDDCTRMTWLYLLKNKNEVFSRFQSFHKQMKTQFNTQIQILCSDNGGEFVNHDFQTYFQQHRIIHERTCPQTPLQNGVAERKNRHLLETARALLIGAHVPRHHWDDAIVTAVHLINRMPSGVLTFKTPLQVLTQHRPLPSVLVLTPRIFGCVAFVHLHKNQRSKLDPCALRCVFVGYATHQKGYSCYHPPTRRTYVTLDVTFLESELFFHDPSSNSTLQGEIRSEEQNWSNLENEEILLCIEMIDHPESGAQDYSMPKSDQSPIHSDQLPDPPDPYEDISDSSQALYGLKQSPRAWFGRFTMAMKNNGFKQCNSDHTLLLKHRKGKEISQLQDYLATEFEMKDIGGLKYFLGIEVARSQQGIFLSQRKYVLDLLTDTGMLDCKPADTPIVHNHHLGEYPDQVSTNKERYQRYLKSAPGKGLMFSKHSHLNIDGYSDADWAGNVTDRKSTSGYFTFVGGNLVTWRSKKQNVVALSSAEAEFRGMTKGICELLWLRKLLTELGYKPTSTMNLFCDNKAAIAIAQNPVQHDRTKHVEVDRHFIKQKLEAKVFQFPFVKSEDQLVDILTKAISSKAFHNSLDQLGIGDIYAPT